MEGKLLKFERTHPITPRHWSHEDWLTERQNVEEFIRGVREANLRERRRRARKELLAIGAVLLAVISFAAGAWWAVK